VQANRPTDRATTPREPPRTVWRSLRATPALADHPLSRRRRRRARPGTITHRADHREPARPANDARPAGHPSNGPRQSGPTANPISTTITRQANCGRSDPAANRIPACRSVVEQTTENRLALRTTPGQHPHPSVPVSRRADHREPARPANHARPTDHPSNGPRTVRTGCQPHPSVSMAHRADHREPARPANHARPTDHPSNGPRTVRTGCQPHPSVPMAHRADHREPARPANHARPTDHPSNGPRTVRTGSTRLPTASQRAGQSSSGPPTVWISSTS
jgi:hypothetical protein